MDDAPEPFRLEFDPHARRQLRRVRGTHRRRIDEQFDILKQNPRPPRSLMLRRNLFRVPVGDWRIFFVVDHEQRVVTITDVLRRNEATYRDL